MRNSAQEDNRSRDLIGDLVSTIIGIFSPQRAIRYRLGRSIMDDLRFRTYDAAKKGGANKNWSPQNKSADSILKLNNSVVVARARDLERNNDYISGAIDVIINNVIGTGMIPYPTIRDGQGNLNDPLNDSIAELWKVFAKKADVSGAGSFWELNQIALRHFLIDGECFGHFVIRKISREKRGEMPLRLEIFEPEQVDGEIHGVMSNGNKAVRGIEFNPDGEIVNYWVLPEHPDGLGRWGMSKPVKASDIIHIYKRKRASQTRGVSQLAACIMKMFDLYEYQDYEMIGAKLAAAFGVFIESPADEFPTDESITTDESGDTKGKYQYIDPGRIERLKSGEKIQIASHSRPSNNYQPFVQTTLRGGAAALNLSYETFSKDFAQSSYSSARSGVLEERRGYRVLQNYIVEKFNQPIWEKFIEIGILSGLIKASLNEFKNLPEKYYSVKWRTPGWEWIDPLKDVSAAEKALDLKITSREKICAEKGDDFYEVAEGLAAEDLFISENFKPEPETVKKKIEVVGSKKRGGK